MRRMLLGTTALAAAGLVAASPGLAAEKLKVGIGGYMEQWVGFANNDDSTVEGFTNRATHNHPGDDMVDPPILAGESDATPVRLPSLLTSSETDPHTFATVTDAEVHFKGSTTLDNGITVDVQIELEGGSRTDDDQIDESYIRVGGGFGQFVIGSENSAMYTMHYGVPDFGIGLNSGDMPNWASWTPGLPNYYRAPLGSTNVEPNATNDSEKITYFTPRIEGFQLGLSYGPDNAEHGGIEDRNSANHDLFAVGLNFNRSFDAATVQVSGGYGTIQTAGDGGDDPSAYNVGLRVGIGGFGAAAAYSNFDDSRELNGEGISVGASYTSGPWGISLAWFNGERDGTTTMERERNPETHAVVADGAMIPAIVGQRSHSTIHLSGKYALGPGITANATLGFTKLETDDTYKYPGEIGADEDDDTYEATAERVTTAIARHRENSEHDASYFVVGLKISF